MLRKVIMAAIILAAALRPAPPASQMAAANPLPALPLEVSVKEAAQLREQGAFMLDVRQPEEWEAGHIPGAVLIPLAELPKRLNEVPADQTVVVVCRSGNRAPRCSDPAPAGFHRLQQGAGKNIAHPPIRNRLGP